MRLWQALEALPGPAAVLAEWRRLAGAEGLDLLTPYLQPLPRLAASYPRLVGGEPTYPYEVVEHGPDDFVGVCPETEDRIVLARNDLVIYELDWPLFLADIAAALHIVYGVLAALYARSQYGIGQDIEVSLLDSMIAFQAMVNIGVNLNLLPATGLPLPFISYGGSSLLSLLLGIGLVESVVLRHKTLEF